MQAIHCDFSESVRIELTFIDRHALRIHSNPLKRVNKDTLPSYCLHALKGGKY